MRKYKQILQQTTFLILVILFACGDSKENPHNVSTHNGEEIISVNPDKIDSDYGLKASLLMENMRYVPLESPSGVVIGNVDRVITNKGTIKILDRMSNSVFVFDLNGKYIATVNKEGKGPGEYASIDNFSVDNITGNIEIISFYNKKVLTYNIRGEFIKDQPIDFLAADFIRLPQTSIAVYNPKFENRRLSKDFPTQPRFFIWDENGVSREELNVKYNGDIITYPQSSNNFYRWRDTLSLIEPVGYKIYRVDEKLQSLSAKFIIDFQHASNPLNFEMDEGEVSTTLKDYFNGKSKEWVSLHNVFETEEALLIKYATSEDDQFLGLVTADSFIQMISENHGEMSDDLKEIGSQVKSSDNPILVIFDLKSF